LHVRSLNIMTATVFAFQLQQDCLHMVRSNKVVLRLLGAIADDHPAVQNFGHYWPQSTQSSQWTMLRSFEATTSAWLSHATGTVFYALTIQKSCLESKLNNMRVYKGTHAGSRIKNFRGKSLHSPNPNFSVKSQNPPNNWKAFFEKETYTEKSPRLKYSKMRRNLRKISSKWILSISQDYCFNFEKVLQYSNSEESSENPFLPSCDWII